MIWVLLIFLSGTVQDSIYFDNLDTCLKIAKKIKEIKKGDIIKVKVDDPKAENDINELKKQIKIKIKKKIKHNDFMLFEIEKN